MKQRINEASWIESEQRWKIKVQRDGRRLSFTSSTPGRKGKVEAERKADKWLSSRLVGENTRTKVLLESWYQHLQQTAQRSHCRQQEYYIRCYILPVIGEKKIGNVSEFDLQNVINRAYKSKDLAAKTLKNIRSCLTAFMKYCRSIPCTTLNPENLRIPSGARPSEKKIVPPDKLVTLFSVSTSTYFNKPVEDFYIHAYRFIVVTGLRPGELVGLLWSNIKGDTLKITQSINDDEEVTRGKNINARRTITLSAHAMRILDDQRAMLKKMGLISKYVFPARDGDYTPQHVLRNAWQRYCSANGITEGRTPYELRHTFVSIMDEMPGALKKLLVGHSKSMDTDGVYNHEKLGDRQRAAAYVDEALARILPTKNSPR